MKKSVLIVILLLISFLLYAEWFHIPTPQGDEFFISTTDTAQMVVFSTGQISLIPRVGEFWPHQEFVLNGQPLELFWVTRQELSIPQSQLHGILAHGKLHLVVHDSAMRTVTTYEVSMDGFRAVVRGSNRGIPGVQ